MRSLPAEPLARHSTFRAGGRSDVVLVESGEALEQLALAGALPRDVGLVLGGGSNVLVSDDGVSGTVLIMRSQSAALPESARPDPDGIVWLDGAADWSTVALSTARLGWQGLESMVGIPGTVGGAVVQSIGAYGYELRDRFVAARAVDLENGSVLDLGPSDMGFRYRNSDLKVQSPPRVVVTRVGLRLSPGALHQPIYAELDAKLASRTDAEPGGYRPADVAAAVLDLRRSKSMVHDPTDSQTWGAGSFFKNPECDENEFAGVCGRLGVPATAVPHWPIAGVIRLSAGWLVEQAGFKRGHREGNVALCDRHALGIVNVTGRASASEIANFAGRIRQGVHARSGVVLDPEPVLVGLTLPPLT